jgi:hypothetical protein
VAGFDPIIPGRFCLIADNHPQSPVSALVPQCAHTHRVRGTTPTNDGSMSPRIGLHHRQDAGGERCDPRANRSALRSGPCRPSASSLLAPARATRLAHRPLRVTSRSCLERRKTARLGIIPRMGTDLRSGEALGVAGNHSTELKLTRLSGSADSNRGPLVPQTSAYLAPTNRIQRRVLSSGNGWNETYTPETGIA